MGRFERLCILGMGTTTITEKARIVSGPRVGQVVALVHLSPHWQKNERVRERFIEKGRALVQLGDAVAETIEAREGDAPFIARDFASGISVRQVLATVRGPDHMPQSLACHLVAQMGSALLSLRRRLRLVAPRFIQFSFASTLRQVVILPSGRPLWTDPFGLDDPAAPERSVDPPAEEARALATLLYELLCSRPVPKAEELAHFSFCAPSSFRGDVADGMDSLIERALVPHASEPICAVGDFLTALGRVAARLGAPDTAFVRRLLADDTLAALSEGGNESNPTVISGPSSMEIETETGPTRPGKLCGDSLSSGDLAVADAIVEEAATVALRVNPPPQPLDPVEDIMKTTYFRRKTPLSEAITVRKPIAMLSAAVVAGAPVAQSRPKRSRARRMIVAGGVLLACLLALLIENARYTSAAVNPHAPVLMTPAVSGVSSGPTQEPIVESLPPAESKHP
jgi:hypothetical protein